MKRFLLAAFAFAALAGIASAQDDPMTPRYGNTVVVKSAAGEELKLFYNADHTMSATNAKGESMKGTWELNDGNICVTQTEPAPKPEDTMPATQCNPFQPHNVGDTWTLGEGENTVTATIVQGR
ncbi:MAG TPA: hypothetical protein VI565_10215 [Burkholderiales bacterium]|nr:hypothetical protein [Burkholderiales bacterium]